MLPLGLGEYVEGALKPHLIYARRQGTSLAVAAVFGIATVLFLLVALFFALLYVMPPLMAALLLALLCATVVAVMVAIVQRRAKLREAAGSEAVAIEEGKAAEVTLGRLLAVRALMGAILPTLAIGAVAFLIGRRSGD